MPYRLIVQRAPVVFVLTLVALFGSTGQLAIAQQGMPTVRLFTIGASDGVGVIDQASGLAAAPDGALYVLDGIGDRVQRFAPDGTVTDVWGDHGSAEGRFDAPASIALAPDGSVYVADAGNNRVQRFDAHGMFLGAWGSEASGPGRLLAPEGVAVGWDGTVFVSDTGSDQVKRFSADGTFLAAFGQAGAEADRLDRPRQVATGANDSVYVIDYGHDRIQRFGYDGTPMHRFAPVPVPDPGQDDRPLTQLAVGADGTVYVVLIRSHVYHFTADGRQTGKLDVYDGSYFEIVALAVMGSDRLFVAKARYAWSKWSTRQSVYEVDIHKRPEYMIHFPTKHVGLASAADASAQFGRLPNSGPSRMSAAVSPDGTLHVGDSFTGRIQRFRADGLYLGERGGFSESRPSSIYGPGVAAAPDGSVWVANPMRGELVHLGADGSDLGSFEVRVPPGDEDGETVHGVAVAPDGSLFAVDAATGLVQHVSPDGTVLGTWGSRGRYNSEIFGFCADWDVIGVPCSAQPVVVSPDGTVVYVLDSANGRIKRSTADGEPLSPWTGLTPEKEFADTAQGVATAPDGTLFAADTAAGRVVRFGPDGAVNAEFVGTRGRTPASFDRPGAIAVAPDSTLFVTDPRNGRVQAFGLRAPDRWRVEYFGNTWLAERPLAIDAPNDIAFDWGDAAPQSAVPEDGWSARFERTLRLAPGPHQFGLQAAGGARLWLGEDLVVDAWHDTTVRRVGAFNGPAAGTIDLRLEFRDTSGLAALRLVIDGPPLPTETPSPTPTKPAVPTIDVGKSPLYLPIAACVVHLP